MPDLHGGEERSHMGGLTGAPSDMAPRAAPAPSPEVPAPPPEVSDEPAGGVMLVPEGGIPVGATRPLSGRGAEGPPPEIPVGG